MVAPSGTRPAKFTRNFTGSFLTLYEVVVKAWQHSPYNLPLQYDREMGTYAQSIYTPNSYYASSPFNAETIIWNYFTNNLRTLCQNKAYEVFKGKIYGQAALGVDFAEARQSLGMMARTCGTLLKVARQIKRGRFFEAKETLGMHFIPKGVSVRKSFANNWLEYHFGWEPLVRDIYDAAEVVNNPLKTFSMAKGTGKTIDPLRSIFVNFGSTFNTTQVYNSYMAYQGGRVQSITSGTAHTLDQFGLINPAVILWELVPFSFVVDWFTNVGDVLASYSDFAGINLTDTYNGYTIRTGAYGHTGLNAGFAPVPGYVNMYYSGAGVAHLRLLGLTKPSFAVKQLRLPSKIRALTAVSLLIQQLKS
ncbi:maturation protein [ssRNA phage Zoerhiza.2_10]|uniref:Maturation protein n=2 Tax=Fiersviridae TaxID=2842319 RepID=A0A8S5L2J3_9VIRU|nr:maturation protein [ssRNA phage Zoerhiza.2_10]QDH89458.1 MAG: hypothetical protein H2Rhizo31670_000003 [Leviviridae sp.]DAD51715.1 TPA_asm: maturation protein [ssRNA phage Zoerhiza.2_10]